MPFNKSTTRIVGLSKQEKDRLTVLINEMEKRGLSLPEEYLNLQQKKFPTDSRGYFVKSDGKLYIPNDDQEEFIESNARFVLLSSGRGGGKPLAIDTEILTSSGWTTMEKIKVGDDVFDSTGKRVKVINVSPIMYGHNCYELIFSDGTSIIADEQHEWVTWTHRARKAHRRAKNPGIHPEKITTLEIKNSLTISDRGDINHSIKVPHPLEFRYKYLPIDPYVFGLWLGDGCNYSGRFTIAELEIVENIKKHGYLIKKESYKYSWKVDVIGEKGSRRNKKTGRMESNPESFHGMLKSLNVLNNKHIPDIYKFSRFEQRLALIQGLMDSDGYIDKRGQLNFDGSNEKLINDVYDVLSSMGIRVTKTAKTATLYGKDCGISYRLLFYTTLPIFQLHRKLNRIKSRYSPRVYHRYIKEVNKVESVPVKCITVNSDSHLYLVTRALIATHNSAAGAQKSLRKIEQGEDGAVFNPVFENFKTSTWPEFKEWIPWDMVVPGQRYRSRVEWEPHQPFTMAFINGVKVICKGLNDPNSARGPNINWLWYDEAGSDRDGLAWQIAVPSVRVGKDPQAFVTTTPKGRNHWLYRFFIKQDIPEDALKLFELEGGDRELIHYVETTIHNNIDNLDPGFVASILATYPTGWLREQEVFGKFVDEGGHLGDPAWFKGRILPERPETVFKRVRYWDLAASEKKIFGPKRNDPDETVGTLLSWDGELKFTIENQVCGHWEWLDIKEQIRRTAELDGPYIPIHIEQEPASGGKNQVAELINFIREQLGATYSIYGHNPREIGDKIMRANVWFAEAAQGRFYMVQGNWNDGFLDQLSSFPEGHDDRIDSVSGARHIVAPVRTWKNIPFLKV